MKQIIICICLLVGLIASSGQSTPAVDPAVPQTINPKAGKKLVWSDEFNYPDKKLDLFWTAQNGPSGHILCSRWRENCVVKNGTLQLINKKEKRAGQDWTSGSLTSKRKFLYGYFECRYKYAAAEATNNSFWLMTQGEIKSSDKRAHSFEIDINEGHYPSEINTNIHDYTNVTIVNGERKHFSDSKSIVPENKPDLSQQYHIYGLLWTPEELVYFFDGKEIRRMKNDFCFSESPIWLSLAIIKWAGKISDKIDGTYMDVDYVRVYQ